VIDAESNGLDGRERGCCEPAPFQKEEAMSFLKVDRAFAAAFLVASVAPAVSPAGTIQVNPGESIQAAIDVAGDGDVIMVGAGTFGENINFNGKAIAVVGAGPSSILRGTGTGPVVTFASGEGGDSVLDSFLITGGSADRGGGVYIDGASPTVLRNVIFNNQAREQGSGVYLRLSNAALYNNLVVYNRTGSGDPHSIEIVGSGPRIINNTVARGDSNGLIVRGASPVVIMNNVISYNGLRVNGDRRGRGICDFSVNQVAVIQYNVFHGNNVAALLTGGTDYRSIRGAQRSIAPPRLLGNVDGKPGWNVRRPRRLEDLGGGLPNVQGFMLSAVRPGAAIDRGNPDPAYNDLDGSRNDAGFTGGPYAAE
jgi:hypothetical protein